MASESSALHAATGGNDGDDDVLRHLRRQTAARTIQPALRGGGSAPLVRSRCNNLTLRLQALSRFRGRPNTQAPNFRTVYNHVYPSTTLYDVDVQQDLSLRKFSPCGRYFVAFSRHTAAHSVSVFQFKWSTRSEEASRPEQLWSSFFRSHFTTTVAHAPDTLSKDFCLFTEHSRYLLIASTRATPRDMDLPSAGRVSSESLNLSSLEDVTLFVISLQDGTITTQRTFPADSINLTHNSGIHLFGDLVVVLSTQHQLIHLLQLRDDGSLLDLMTIGEFCSEDDRHCLDSALRSAQAGPHRFAGTLSFSSSFGSGVGNTVFQQAASQGFARHVQDRSAPTTFIAGLKHRILAFLWRRAYFGQHRDRDIASFGFHFKDYSALCMTKAQIIGEHLLVIKYCSPAQAAMRVGSSGSVAFFVVYNYVTTKVVNVFCNDDEALLKIYEQCADFFRQSLFDTPVCMLPTPANSVWARYHFQRSIAAVRTSRNGGFTQSVRRGLGVLPVAAQSYRDSPYFDMGLFTFDEKSISHTERLKHCADHVAKFYSRLHGGVSFRIQAGPRYPLPSAHQAKKLVSHIFHPFLPFAITVQHVIHSNASTSCCTNFHVRD
eukprot:m.127401 g.127401  ORF g.127401 m.127401 type:complete len:603 (+) comp16705_c0_seq1:187-1995(+)